MPIDHGGKGFTGPRGEGGQLDRSGHQVPNRRVVRISAAQCQFASHSAFGKDPGYSTFCVKHSYGAHAPVQHKVNGVSRAGFNWNCSRFQITEFQNTHNDLLAKFTQPGASTQANKSGDSGIMNRMERLSRALVTKIMDTSIQELFWSRPGHLVSFLNTLPSFITNRTFCRTLISRSGSPFTATISANAPGATTPISPALSSISAAREVALLIASAGDIPSSTIFENSSAIGSVQRIPPMSVPKTIFTPAFNAFWNDGP